MKERGRAEVARLSGEAAAAVQEREFRMEAARMTASPPEQRYLVKQAAWLGKRLRAVRGGLARSVAGTS